MTDTDQAMAGLPSAGEPAPGSYAGMDGFDVRVDLRIDREAVSGDVFSTGPAARFLASFRTLPGEAPRHAAAIPAALLGAQPDATALPVTIGLAHDGGRLSFTLDAAQLVPAPPLDLPIRALLKHRSEHLRQLDLRLALEKDVRPVPHHSDLGSGRIGLRGAFAAEGIELESLVAAPVPAPPATGWSETALHALVAQMFVGPRVPPSFACTLLWLSRFNRRDAKYKGLMFDDSVLPIRRVAAIFTTNIAEDSPASRVDKELLRSAMHEIGHVLNLWHRHELNLTSSLSPMNYDWKYRSGGLREEYWRGFDFRFDADEGAFLRHGAFNLIAPGAAPFKAARYWEERTSGFGTDLPLAAGVRLELAAPSNGAVFDLGQPVTLGLRLSNESDMPIMLAPGGLDIKTGAVRIEVEREGRSTTSTLAVSRFPVQRCVEEGEIGSMLAGKAGMSRNLSLVPGAGADAFLEPGGYKVWAEIALVADGSGKAAVLRSDPLRIRIAVPRTRREEVDALDLLAPESGSFLALAGGGLAPDRVGQLREIAERRAHDATETEFDPVATVLFRALMFHYRRSYPQWAADAPAPFTEPDEAEAKACAQRLRPAALDVLDPITAAETATFIETLSRETKG